jgi:proteic killer suppression protein
MVDSPFSACCRISGSLLRVSSTPFLQLRGIRFLRAVSVQNLSRLRPRAFVGGLDFDLATDLLLALNVAKSLQDLSPLKSVGLHKLKGDRSGQWAMTANGRWRICFVFANGDAHDVEIVDYHRG